MSDRGVSTRALAVFFVVLVVVTGAVWSWGAVTDDEVYPLLSLPGFGRPPSPDNETWTGEVKVVAFETGDETSVELSIADAFHEAPGSFYLDMAESLSRAEPTPEVQRWASSRFDGECVVAIEVRVIPSDDPGAREVEHRIEFDDCDAVEDPA